MNNISYMEPNTAILPDLSVCTARYQAENTLFLARGKEDYVKSAIKKISFIGTRSQLKTSHPAPIGGWHSTLLLFVVV